MRHAKRALILTSTALAVMVRPWLGPAGAADGASPFPAPAPTNTRAIALGQTFTLGEGETVVVGDALTLRFAAVTEDSRCPTDVQCVWEGNAAVRVEASMAADLPMPLCLNTNAGFDTMATYDNYTIELVDLRPYPTTAQTMGPYQATLVVGSIGEVPVRHTSMGLSYGRMSKTGEPSIGRRTRN